MEVAYVAFKSRDLGWVNAATKIESQTYLPYQTSATPSDSNDNLGPPQPDPANNKFYYIPIWEFTAEVKREYGGINSSGGPQVSGRADQTDFALEIPASAASPVIYEHCCSGKQFAWVHVVAPDWKTGSGAWLHIRMQDVNVTGFEFSGVRWLHDKFEAVDQQPLLSSTEINQGGAGLYDVGHFDDITLLYTSIVFDVVGKTTRGWTTGSDEPFPAITRP